MIFRNGLIIVFLLCSFLCQVLPDRTRDESRSQSYPRTVNPNSDIPKRNNTYGTDANTRRDADQWKRDNAYSEQVEKQQFSS